MTNAAPTKTRAVNVSRHGVQKRFFSCTCFIKSCLKVSLDDNSSSRFLSVSTPRADEAEAEDRRARVFRDPTARGDGYGFVAVETAFVRAAADDDLAAVFAVE